MSMENDNGHSSSNTKGGDAVDQVTKMNETDGRMPENRQDGAAGPGVGSRSGEEVEATVVAEADAEAEAESGSNVVAEQPRQSSSARTPFTNLSQIDADLALARTLQEQERAYMMLSMGNEVSDYGSWESGSYLHDEEDEFDDPENEDERDEEDDAEDGYGTDLDHPEDASDVHALEDGEEDDSRNSEIDPGAYSDDEAYARALQEAEEREMATRLFALAGLNDRVQHREDLGHNPQDAWEEVDPDELLYEELLALGEVVGTESRGLSADTIASLPSVRYQAGGNQNGTNESCVICRLDYEDGDDLIVLSCKHTYHPDCINNWLKINKACPVCSTEVSTSGQS